MNDDHTDDHDEPDEPFDAPASLEFHVTHRTTGDRRTLNLDIPLAAWRELHQQANTITDATELDTINWPPGLNTAEKIGLTAWLRHHDRQYLHDDPVLQTWRLTGWLNTETVGHWTESPEARYQRIWASIHTARTAQLAGQPTDTHVPWPQTLVSTLDYAPWGRWTITLYDADEVMIAHHILFIPPTTGEPTPTEPPTTARGQPLKTIDYDNAIAVVTETIRRNAIPGGRPVGHPPSPTNAIKLFTRTQRMAAAIMLVTQYGAPQAMSARTFGVNPQSLNRRLRRDRQRQST